MTKPPRKAAPAPALQRPQKLEIVYRPIKSLKGYSRNARTHSAEQVTQIRRSINEFTWTNPILLKDDNVTVGAGHGRLAAALLPPVIEMVPTITLHGLSDDQWKAYVLADNQIALNAGWDLDLLRGELADLKGLGFDLSLTGFSSLNLRDLFAIHEGNGDPDDAGDPPKDPVSRLGDLWHLGDHRIVCGSSTDAKTVARVLQGAKPHLMVTDPPYGVKYDPDWRNGSLGASGEVKGAVGGKGGRAVGKVLNDDRADWREAWALFPGDVAYIWHGGLATGVVADSLTACGFDLRAQIIWAKSRMVIGRGHYHWRHEPCWYAVRKGAQGHWQGDRKQTTVWDIDHSRSDSGHGTQKPVEAMKRPMENNSEPGDRVYEPFSGSGTSIIAAQLIGRICHAVELSPAYVDVAVKRWQAFTGEEAYLEDGRSFADITAERMGEIV